MGQKFAVGKSSVTKISACIVWSVRCKNYVNSDINLNFQSFDVIFEDFGNKFAL